MTGPQNNSDKNSTASPAISQVAVAMLDLGRRIIRAAGRGGVQPDCVVATEKLRQAAEAHKLLTFDCESPDPLEVQLLATASYLVLMTDSHPNVRFLTEIVGRENPCDVLLARTALRKLCERRALRFRNGHDKYWNGLIGLTPLSMSMLGLCVRGGPVFGESSLGMGAADQKDSPAAAKVPDEGSSVRIPAASVLGARIRRKVKGDYLQTPMQGISAMYVTHLHRAAMIRGGKHPGTPNVIGLLIGSSSVGKTFLAETAATAVNELCGDDTVPFSSFSATDLTQEGYVGCSVEDIFKPLLDRFSWDAAKARFSCCFIDEIDKKACCAGRGALDVGGRGVQEALLRILGGTVLPVGSRRSSWEQKTAQFNSDGTMFLMGGAFVGLDEIRKRPSGGQVGFRGQDGVRGRERLRDCLVEYGLIPELVSRIGSVIVCNDPQLPDLVDICNAPGGLITCYRHLWRGMGMTVSVTADAVDAMAGYGIETCSFARGMQAVLNRLTERLVFEARKGKVRLGDGDVRAAVESMGDMG